MNRRTLLKTLGLGTAGLAAFPHIPGLGPIPASSASAQANLTLYFVAISDAGTAAGIHHQIVMSGTGEFSASSVKASGGFLHFDNATPVPKKIIGAGRWEATALIGLIDRDAAGRPFGSAGGIHAGIVSMLVDLFPTGGSPIRGARLAVACNIGFAGITTGEPEGFVLTLPAPPGVFRPLSPVAGLTAILEGVPLPTTSASAQAAPASITPPRTGDAGLR